MTQLPLTHWPKPCFAGLGRRFSAFLLDHLLVQAITTILFNLTIHHFWMPDRANQPWYYRLAQLLVLLAYFAGTSLYFQGQTLGKYLLNLRVISRSSDQFDRKTILIREIAGRIILHFFPIIGLSLVFSRQQQHLVDVLCDTVVVDLDQIRYFQKASGYQIDLPASLTSADQ